MSDTPNHNTCNMDVGCPEHGKCFAAQSGSPENCGAFGPVNGNKNDTSLENWFPYSAEELSRLKRENAALRHDIERHVRIASDLATELADLRAKLEAEHDIRADRETVITLLAESLKVNAEPHQSFFDRLCEAAEEATKDAGVARAERDICSARLDAAIKLIADILSALPPNSIKAPDGTVYEFNPPPEYAMKMLRAFKAGIDAAIRRRGKP